jgi:hypothetical protein
VAGHETKLLIMANQLRLEYEGAIYHVTARGNERRKINFPEYDYQKFREYLRTAQGKYGYKLHLTPWTALGGKNETNSNNLSNNHFCSRMCSHAKYYTNPRKGF